jgi:hypothetical protein
MPINRVNTRLNMRSTTRDNRNLELINELVNLIDHENSTCDIINILPWAIVKSVSYLYITRQKI